MATTWPIPPHIAFDEILPYLSPGSVIGVYDDGGWVDWDADPGGPVVMLSDYDLQRRPSGDPRAYYCVVLGTLSCIPSAALHGAMSGLLIHGRGLALVTSRIGLLLRTSHRILCPTRERHSGPQRLRTSEPHLPRTSGEWALRSPRSWRLLDPTEIARSAMLSIRVENTLAAARALEDWPTVRVSGNLVHLSLDGGTAEEILERLKSGGLRVLGSALWYSTIHSSPLEHDIPH